MKNSLYELASSGILPREGADSSSASELSAGSTHFSDPGSPDSESPSATHTQEQTIERSASSTGLDFDALRLPPNYGAGLGVKKLLANVPVGKPRKTQFFRTHPSDAMTFQAMLLEQKESGESYLVMPEVAEVISELVRPVLLHAAIDRQNNVFLIPVPLPGEDGTRNPWHESLAQAIEHAKESWVRITANKYAGGYDVYVAEGVLPDPQWPSYDMNALLEVAFRGKIIKDIDHPVVQALLGKI